MMDQSYSESDLSLSPSQILERLQVLRQLQLMQRGKLQKQRLHYQETSETSSSITEIVSQFSSTSYNTFRSSLQTSRETSNEVTPRLESNSLSQKVKENDLIEGVSVLNLSQESEYIIKSPISNKSRVSCSSKVSAENSPINIAIEAKLSGKKQISLDEMPVLTTTKNFEDHVLEKIEGEKAFQKSPTKKNKELGYINKKPFLKRGQGTSRFGIQKNDLVIQSTKALPWRQRNSKKSVTKQNIIKAPLKKNYQNKNIKRTNVQVVVSNSKETANDMKNLEPIAKPSQTTDDGKKPTESQKQESKNKEFLVDSSNCELHGTQKESPIIKIPNEKHPLLQQNNRGKTWAAVLTKEQSDFLRQLKQSDYYKNFASPAKSTISDMSCDENMAKLRQEREHAEQNLFELLENKVDGESFSIDNSFFSKFLRKNQLECSGDSTPMILQKCLARNPNLLHIVSDLTQENSQSQCQSEMDDSTDCCSEDCCSVTSSCCSCKTVESRNYSVDKNQQTKENLGHNLPQNKQRNIKFQQKVPTREQNLLADQNEIEKDHKGDAKDNTDNDLEQANMAEMNAKLVATSELLKERLQELEDEIETFRKENSNLTKLREEVDIERQKFYEEKSAFEQKFNEEKILSEYYLAEEKERLNKQKQMYERYVREMRGRLNKKEKEEVINLKKEIEGLKEDIRIKDAKSTSTIARLRNHIKIMEKEKKDLQDSVEKLKKENRRIQHSNDITRRLTNMKYLEQINKKLSHISSKDNINSEQDIDVKYKAFEIERQSRGRKVQPSEKTRIRPRAKSVPNINVTSRYAKYFSQRDAVSQMEKDLALNVEGSNTYHSQNVYDSDSDRIEELNNSDSVKSNLESDDEDQNQLEKIYLERFQSSPGSSNRSSLNNPCITDKQSFRENQDGYFLRKSNSGSNKDINSQNNSISPLQNLSNGSKSNNSKSPVSILNRKSNEQISSLERVKETIKTNIYNRETNSQRSKSPISILSNHSTFNQPSNGQKHPSVINLSQGQLREKLMTVSPEPVTISSKASLSKTNLNPTELKKSDGSRELRFPNGNVKYISADGKYSKFVYYNGDIKENFYDEGRIKYYYAEAKTIHTTHPDGLEVLEFPDGQVEKRYKDGSTEIRLPNGSIRYHDPKNVHVREEWRFPDGTALTVAADGERRVTFPNGQIEVHTADHKRREFPDGTVKLVYNDGTSETRYASGRVRIKDKHGNLIMDSAS